MGVVATSERRELWSLEMLFANNPVRAESVIEFIIIFHSHFSCIFVLL